MPQPIMSSQTHIYDVLIIGSGAAGLALALSLADHGRIALICKDGLLTSSSEKAQGGIAAVMSQEDSLESHIQDTLIAGAGLCDKKIVEFTITRAKTAIDWLVKQGVQFSYALPDQTNKIFHLTREGGHSHRRVLHATDRTGAVIVKTLAEQVLSHPRIECFTQCMAIDLLIEDGQCIGVQAVNRENKQILNFLSPHTCLATGGASQVYLYTSNPKHACGDGIAMAWRAGCRIANMEFTQFHPTCLYQKNNNDFSQPFLISEALRGEGARLRLQNGELFMRKYDSRAELASRDIVARAIHTELKNNQIDYVHLDITHRPKSWIQQTFPTIFEACLKINLDMSQTPIPVVPAAHYTCGGVMTNHQGETDTPGLYAIGEVAYTGLHGANRLASNSLLECLVFAQSTGKLLQKKLLNTSFIKKELTHLSTKRFSVNNVVCPKKNKDNDKTEITLLLRCRHQLQKIMWDHVGIVRNNKDLQKAKTQIQFLKQESEAWRQSANLSQEIYPVYIELRNLFIIAELMVESALSRKESRGLHYNEDYPDLKGSSAVPTIVALNFCKKTA